MLDIRFIFKAHHTNRNGETVLTCKNKKKTIQVWLREVFVKPRCNRLLNCLSWRRVLLALGDIKELLERKKINGTIRTCCCLQLKHSRDWVFNQSLQIFTSSTAHIRSPLRVKKKKKDQLLQREQRATCVKKRSMVIPLERQLKTVNYAGALREVAEGLCGAAQTFKIGNSRYCIALPLTYDPPTPPHPTPPTLSAPGGKTDDVTASSDFYFEGKKHRELPLACVQHFNTQTQRTYWPFFTTMCLGRLFRNFSTGH